LSAYGTNADFVQNNFLNVLNRIICIGKYNIGTCLSSSQQNPERRKKKGGCTAELPIVGK